MTKSQKSQPAASIKAAFTAWMHGTPFRALKKQLHRPLMQTFAQLAGASTFKAAKSARDKAVKQERKRGAA